VLLALVAAGTVSGKINLGQSLAVMVIVVDTVVAVIGLALALQVKAAHGNTGRERTGNVEEMTSDE